VNNQTAGLPMYDFPEIRDATDAFWLSLSKNLRARGVANVPAHLTRPHDLPQFWSDPNLLFGQTCGYPLSIGLCGDATIIATPVYDAPGCEGPHYGSFLIVPAASSATSLADTKGGICAINMSDSNTGMNLLRAAIADIGGTAPFYAKVVETLSHRKSLAMVASGQAHIAAIDCVSFFHFSQIEPEITQSVRVIGETRKTPGLPFITSAKTPADAVYIMREALSETVHQTPRPAWLDTLRLRDIEVLPLSAYDAVLALEREAAAKAYPVLA